MLAGGALDHALAPEAALPRHLLAPLADRMMTANPALRLAFAQALAEDPGLAADPQARLRWWLTRSEYHERAVLTYPVMMERDGAPCAGLRSATGPQAKE